MIVRLGEIADVELGAQNYDRMSDSMASLRRSWASGFFPTANSLDVIKSVRAAIPGIQAQLPAGMKVGIPYDSTAYIQDAINEVLAPLRKR